MNAPGVHTFAVPMPGPLGTVNVHLVELDDGYLLIDTGWNMPESLGALELGLAERGVAWADLRTLLITHLHPDHVGNAAVVLERSGARLLMHRVDAANLALVASVGRSPFFDEAWRIAGVPPAFREKMDERSRGVRVGATPLKPAWELEGGERIAVRHGWLEVVWTPGHSAGHICLYSPEHRFLISGDHILEDITPNVGWRPGYDMLAQFLDSIEKVQGLDVDWVLPSHGSPFQGHRARLSFMREHHDERCRRIREHIAREPLTVQALVERLWPRRLSLIDHHLALLEVLAHLEYLRRRGPIAAEAQADGSLVWRESV
jgi:glyoxylase-like metal-dependent hydrolase (beta-lactamase superfamily II)